MSNQLVAKFATRFSVDQSIVVNTLKNTCFKGNVSDEQMTALLIVADQYGLNPFTKEIYAFPDKNNGFVPVVGVDGWSRIVNEHPQFDGIDFDQKDDACTCRIYRKDRSHAISVTEYLDECKRANFGPWQSHPKRMLRHKSFIQCARLAFGFVGIFDQDEAERIVDVKDITPVSNNQNRMVLASEIIASKSIEKDIDPLLENEKLDLIRRLEIVAGQNGIDGYSNAFHGLTHGQRRLLGEDHLRIKEIASKTSEHILNGSEAQATVPGIQVPTHSKFQGAHHASA